MASENVPRKRVYIAGPMTGLPEKNYPAFNKAAQALRDKGYAVLNPIDVDVNIPEGYSPPYDWFLRQTMQMLCRADAMALLPDWEQSTGAMVEWQFAKACGMDIRLISEWLTGAMIVPLTEPTC